MQKENIYMIINDCSQADTSGHLANRRGILELIVIYTVIIAGRCFPFYDFLFSRETAILQL